MKGIANDGLFTIDEQRELAEGIPNAELVTISSGEGHDGFLLEFEEMNSVLSLFFEKHSTGLGPPKIPLKPPNPYQSLSKGGSLVDETKDVLLW